MFWCSLDCVWVFSLSVLMYSMFLCTLCLHLPFLCALSSIILDSFMITTLFLFFRILSLCLSPLHNTKNPSIDPSSQAFMFETSLSLSLTKWSTEECGCIDEDYWKCWKDLECQF